MNDNVWTMITVALLIILMIGNRKVHLILLFSKQVQVFKNAQNNKISVWDILCFIVFPICCKRSSKIHIFSPQSAHFYGSPLASN